MNLNEIEALLKRFYDGESSLDEEQRLRGYFNQEIIPDHLSSHQEQFRYYNFAREEKIPQSDLESDLIKRINQVNTGKTYGKRHRAFYFVTGIAASILIFIGIYFQFIADHNNTAYSMEDTYEDPEAAYAEAKKALLIVSEKFNAGVNDFNKFSSFNQYKELITRKN